MNETNSMNVRRSNKRQIAGWLRSVLIVACAVVTAAFVSTGTVHAKTNRYLMIGDSYSDPYYAGATKAWQEYVTAGLGLKNTVYKQRGGAGFAKPTNSFVMLLREAGKMSASERATITHILIGGGMGNDYTSGADKEAILDAMATFNAEAHSLFPNLTRILYSGFNWGITATRKQYLTNRLPWYIEGCTKLNWTYLTGSENALREKPIYATYYYIQRDKIHPKTPGQYLIANAIMKSMVTKSSITGVTTASYYKITYPSKYTITYSLNGGTVSGNPTQYYDGFITAMTLQNPTRSGYTFLGWKGTGVSSASTKVVIPIGATGNRTYTAYWKKNTTYAATPVLIAKRAAATQTTLTVGWNKIAGATKYQVYGGKRGEKATFKRSVLATTQAVTLRNLTPGTYYKYYVIAYKNTTRIATSPLIYLVTQGGVYTNYKSVSLNATSKSLRVGSTFQLQATPVKIRSTGAIAKYAGIRYISNTPQVATVSASGLVTAKQKGPCTVFAVTQTGVYASISIVVW